MSNIDPAFYVLKVFRAAGVHPFVKSNPLLILLFMVNSLLVASVVVLASVGVWVSSRDNDINSIVDYLQSIFMYSHILGKYFSLFYNKMILAEILRDHDNFIELSAFGGIIQNEYEQLLAKTSKGVNVFMSLCAGVMFSFYLQPYVTNGDLPVSVYIPNGWYYYIQAGYIFLAPCILASIYGTDALFWGVSVPVIVQFKLLMHKIQNIKIEQSRIKDERSQEEFKNNLRELVNHQNFLFDHCKKINRFNNGIFLNQFMLSVGIICMQLYIVSQKGFSLPNKLKCLDYCFMEIVETGIYCLNAELITDASEGVGATAYSSLWYESDDPEVRRFIILIIARSQKQIIFSGYGFVYINLKTFTQIFKTALSFYSYLHNLVLS